MTTDSVSFPRQHARTQRFTLGAPRAFTVAPSGSHLVFLRSSGGSDRRHALWVREPESGREYRAADPEQLLGGADEELPAEERARRERSREGSAGIVGYATDRAVQVAAFALSGRLYLADLLAAECRVLPACGPVVDPRPSPDGRHVAYVAQGALRVVAVDGGGDRALAEPDAPGVTWGLAEFVAAEEMSRLRGFWWSPESDRLLVARVDESPVRRWWIADPAHPEREPAEVAYPAAGTDNASVSLHLRDLAGGPGVQIAWDQERYPYLARVHWSGDGPPLLLVQARDQRSQCYLTVDPTTGSTETLLTERDPVWLELFGGVPVWTPDGRLVRIADRDGARVLMLGDTPVTGPELHVRAVLDVGERDVLFSASPGEASRQRSAGGRDEDDTGDGSDIAGLGAIDGPGRIGVFSAPYAPRDTTAGAAAGPGSEVAGGAPHPGAAAPVGAAATWEFVTTPWSGVASAMRGGSLLVTVESTLASPRARHTVHRLDENGRLSKLADINSFVEAPVLTARPTLAHTGASRIPSAVLLPTGYQQADGPLPVLLDPYGGPHGARVVAAQQSHLTSQWFADQGFAVVVADGRGTPGYSPAWEKAVRDNLAGATLDDQVEALHALAEHHPLDLGRVAIRGWSYGGYLAALAALRRPDVFHAAVVGAPVTDLRLYDTHYTERYLGHPDQQPAVYAANSLVTDEGLSGAAEPHRPLMVIHGLADDNVVVAHSLRLSSALLAAGRPHEVLPLSGITHMATDEQTAENLLLLQVDFLRRSLGLATPGTAGD